MAHPLTVAKLIELLRDQPMDAQVAYYGHTEEREIVEVAAPAETMRVWHDSDQEHKTALCVMLY